MNTRGRTGEHGQSSGWEQVDPHLLRFCAAAHSASTGVLQLWLGFQTGLAFSCGAVLGVLELPVPVCGGVPALQWFLLPSPDSCSLQSCSLQSCCPEMRLFCVSSTGSV